MALNDNRHVITVSDSAALAKAAAERVLARIAANGGRVAICLTGGSSPKQLYQLLASDACQSRIPWDGPRPLVHRRAILTRVLEGENLPASRAYSIGETVWLVDKAALPENFRGR
jgi:hypothetical protein